MGLKNFNQLSPQRYFDHKRENPVNEVESWKLIDILPKLTSVDVALFPGLIFAYWSFFSGVYNTGK